MTTINTQEAPAEELVLSEDEQESLAIGERLAQAHGEAAVDKLSEEARPEAESQDEEDVKSDDTDTEEGEYEDLEAVLNDFWDEFNGNEEEYSDELLERLANVDPSELAVKYAQLREEYEGSSDSAPKQFTEEDVSTLKGMVGGDENYTQMVNWAAENLPREEVELFNSVMSRGDPLAAYYAIQATALRYADADGVEGTRVSGRTKASSGPGDVFRSRAELVSAMNDPRYENDPAYRTDLFNKLERSNLEI
jgi:hypothetical protein